MVRLSSAELFDSATLSADLARKSVRGGVTTLGVQLGRTSVQMLGVVVLARVLTPQDYGLVAMATVVVGLAQMFKDAGLATATVQTDAISESQISTLFWLNMAVSLTLALCTMAAAPLVVAFYHEPELGPVTIALSLSFLAGGVSIQHEALLRRHMRFAALGAAQFASQVVTVTVSIIGALSGLGYWSLVVGTLSGSLALTIGVLWFCPWVPGRPRRGTGARRMVKFGGNIMGFSLANYFSRNTDYLLIGRLIGADALGLYTKAYQLFMLPIGQIRTPLNDVALPALSALKGESSRYASYYRRLLELLALLTVPLASYCVIEGQFVVDLLLGQQWRASVPFSGFLRLPASSRPWPRPGESF